MEGLSKKLFEAKFTQLLTRAEGADEEELEAIRKEMP